MSLKKLKPNHVFKAILLLWVLFATIYVLYGEYRRLNVFVYNNGYTTALAGVIKSADQCEKPVKVTLGDAEMNLIGIHCLQQQQPVEGTVEAE